MANLSLREVNQSQLESAPIVDGQLNMDKHEPGAGKNYEYTDRRNFEIITRRKQLWLFLI